MKIGVPSGIGDISWVVSKLINTDEWKDIEIVIADGWPFRAKPYLDMLGVKSSYGDFRYEDILSFEKYHIYANWKDITDSRVGMFLMQPNLHLERGFPLSQYLPDLETNYHYPMIYPDITNKEWYNNIEEGRWIGISAASYRGHKAWSTWGEEEWVELCEKLISDGYRICLMGGAWDDLTASLSASLIPNVINLVGKTSFPEACSLHKLLKFYIGFSSGLGIIRSVMGLPTMMLWPDHQQPLSMSWADPSDLDSYKYIPSSYMSPKSVFNLFKIQEERWRDYDGK